jgi:NADH-quinone oxidoreductase subunit L
MWVPLVILAVCAALVGVIFADPTTGWFAHHVEHTPGLAAVEGVHHSFDFRTATIGTVAALLGLGLSYYFYALRSPIPAQLATRFRPLYLASLNKFYIDEFYDRLIVLPTTILAKTAEFIDVVFVENLVRLAAWIPRAFGRYALGPFQNGLIQFYAGATALGVAAVLFFFIVQLLP